MDRPWAAYALADLNPEHFGFTSWFCAADGSALILVYRAFTRTIVMCVEDSGRLDANNRRARAFQLVRDATREPITAIML